MFVATSLVGRTDPIRDPAIKTMMDRCGSRSDPAIGAYDVSGGGGLCPGNNRPEAERCPRCTSSRTAYITRTHQLTNHVDMCYKYNSSEGSNSTSEPLKRALAPRATAVRPVICFPLRREHEHEQRSHLRHHTDQNSLDRNYTLACGQSDPFARSTRDTGTVTG